MNPRPGFRPAERLLNDPALKQSLGKNGRAYAERAFEIEAIADRFEALFAECRVGGAWQSRPGG